MHRLGLTIQDVALLDWEPWEDGCDGNIEGVLGLCDFQAVDLEIMHSTWRVGVCWW